VGLKVRIVRRPGCEVELEIVGPAKFARGLPNAWDIQPKLAQLFGVDVSVQTQQVSSDEGEPSVLAFPGSEDPNPWATRKSMESGAGIASPAAPMSDHGAARSSGVPDEINWRQRWNEAGPEMRRAILARVMARYPTLDENGHTVETACVMELRRLTEQRRAAGGD